MEKPSMKRIIDRNKALLWMGVSLKRDWIEAIKQKNPKKYPAMPKILKTILDATAPK